jgi:lipid II:glycine glycyltransferase (peptidoglycan interpeptide bridge formation enzyme)
MAEMIEHVDQSRWRELARLFLDYSYRHLWDFGTACALRLGATSEHVALKQGDNVAGIADVRIKKIPGLHTGIAYINGGPMVRKDDDTDSERLRFCLHVLVDEYVKKRGLVLRILAPLGPPGWNDTQMSIFTSVGFVPAHARARRYRTFLLDIDRPLEEIRENLGQKWRNNLKRAEKENLSFQRESSIDFFNRFLSLYGPFIQRKGFDVDLYPDFYMEVQNALGIHERFQVALCEYNGNWIAGHISSLLGDTAVNIFRANNEVALTHRASYILQWEGICYAKGHGCQWYDLGGIDPDKNPGVYHFKKGLGGIDIAAPGPFELSPSRLKGYLVTGGEYLYHTIRRAFRPR